MSKEDDDHNNKWRWGDLDMNGIGLLVMLAICAFVLVGAALS